MVRFSRRGRASERRGGERAQVSGADSVGTAQVSTKSDEMHNQSSNVLMCSENAFLVRAYQMPGDVVLCRSLTSL